MNKLIIIGLLTAMLSLCTLAFAEDPEPPGGKLCAPTCRIDAACYNTHFEVTLVYGGIQVPHMSFTLLDLYYKDANGESIGYEADIEWDIPSGSPKGFLWPIGCASVLAIGTHGCMQCEVWAFDMDYCYATP